MADTRVRNLIGQLRALVAAEGLRGQTDRELLERFARQRDEAAFTTLVHRHGSMVLRVCRTVLGHEQDAEDAFQATFLVLARKAGTLRWQPSIGSWLYEVARRVAREAKTKASRRRSRDAQASRAPAADPLNDLTGRDLLEALDEEVLGLTEKYRGPLVLCCLEGKSGDEAAQQLGCSLSTLKRRLNRAREVLHARLTGRGLALSASAVATLLLHGAASAAVPTTLEHATVRAASLFAAGGDLAGAISTNTLALAETVLKGMTLNHGKWAAAVLMTLALGGAGLWAHQLVDAPEAPRADERPALVSPKNTREIPIVVVKEERFDRDPGWEGFNNRVVAARVPTVTQGFGYSRTNFAGREKGEIGGLVTRSTTPAYYADKIAVKTLDDRLTASGTFALTASSSNSAVFFGWFNAEQPGGGRPINSLGLYLDGEKDRDGKAARLAVRLVSGTNRSCGTYVTPYVAGQHRPTSIRTDGTRYTWSLVYDPDANDGNGRLQFTIASNLANPEAWEANPCTVDLPAGFKREGAALDRFGLMNLMTPGNTMSIYFDDLRYDEKAEDFAQDPGWEGRGNQAMFPDPEQAGTHDFGYSAETNFAGGSAGEIGGTFWRASTGYAYYADRVGPLTLEDRLEARGRIVLKVAAQQSDMYLGWFNCASKDKPPVEGGHFLGIHIGGPSRVGHYFRPAYTTAQGTHGEPKAGPVLVPDRVCEWALLYDPTANDGEGAIQLTLGDESVTLPLRKGRRAREASFDRFGLFTSDHGGSLLKVYFDDLKYTVRSAR